MFCSKTPFCDYLGWFFIYFYFLDFFEIVLLKKTQSWLDMTLSESVISEMFRPLEIIKSKVCPYRDWALLFVTVLRRASSLLLLSIKSMKCKEWTVCADESHFFNAKNLLKLFSPLSTSGTGPLMNTSAFIKLTVFNSWVKSSFRTSDCCLHIVWPSR